MLHIKSPGTLRLRVKRCLHINTDWKWTALYRHPMNNSASKFNDFVFLITFQVYSFVLRIVTDFVQELNKNLMGKPATIYALIMKSPVCWSSLSNIFVEFGGNIFFKVNCIVKKINNFLIRITKIWNIF
jgi:hypothetical protein